jgi:SAM-dependent methyltransferase
MGDASSAFKTVFASTTLNDGLYFYLQSVYRLYPEDQFHYILAMAAKDKNTDEEIYREAQKQLPEIKPFLQKFTYSLPTALKLKKEIAKQTLRLLGDRKMVDGCLEIGSVGRYVGAIRKKVRLKGHVYVMNDIAPTNTVTDIFERGGLGKMGRFIPLTYQPITKDEISDESLDVVACYNGLHHCPPELLNSFIQSIHRVLRKGGVFILREHDVNTPQLLTFVSIVHTVGNIGANVPWQKAVKEFSAFRPISEWVDVISSIGFKDSGERLLQDKDHSANTLLSFAKV